MNLEPAAAVRWEMAEIGANSGVEEPSESEISLELNSRSDLLMGG